MACVASEPEDRPTMGAVVHMLKKLQVRRRGGKGGGASMRVG